MKDDGDLSFSDLSSGHPPLLVYQPKGQHTHTFIILHGRGSNAQSFGPEFMLSEHSSGKSLQDLLPGVKFVFPTARRRRMAGSNRCTIPQWFDIISVKDAYAHGDVQIEGLRESSVYIHEIVWQEMNLVRCKNIILGGLSQGCAAGLYALLTFIPPRTRNDGCDLSIGAMVGMSGWLPFCKEIDEMMCNGEKYGRADDPFERGAGAEQKLDASTEALNFVRENIDFPPLTGPGLSFLQTPIFLGHGTADKQVDIRLGEEAASTLKGIGMDVTWVAYRDFYHWYKEPDEIDDIITFLRDKARM
ncbi:hypothetical protein MMC13_007974 [Lambiella insularis]|nr:hypothetical protein [Lambiella insularis]